MLPKVAARNYSVVSLILLIQAYIVFGAEVRLSRSFQRYNDTLTDLVYITSDNFPTSISEFTVCSWVKPVPRAELQASSINGARIFTLQLSGYSDAADFHVDVNAGNKLILGMAGASWITNTLEVEEGEEYLFDRWFHACVRWSSSLSGKSEVSIMKPDGTYATASKTDVRNSAFDNAAGSGSILMFHEQDGGLPTGALSVQQSLRGELSGFQIFMRYLTDSQLQPIGCDVRADTFDSHYDNVTRLGYLKTSMILQDFCEPETAPGKWRQRENPVSPKGTLFAIQHNVTVSGIDVEIRRNISRLPKCLFACMDLKGCHSVTYNQAAKECQLVTGDIFDWSGGSPLEESEGTTFYSGHYIHSH